jgi:hypothetical protein
MASSGAVSTPAVLAFGPKQSSFPPRPLRPQRLGIQADFLFRCTSSRDTAAGVTPEMREAWPTVAGR